MFSWAVRRLQQWHRVASSYNRWRRTGWSLGGLTALEVAKLLVADLDHRDAIRVVGVVLLNSPYPGPGPTTAPAPKLAPNRPFLHETCPPELTMLVGRSMKRAGRMVERWTVPTWWMENGRSPPPAILLRCTETVPAHRERDDARATSGSDYSDVWDDGETTVVAVDRFRQQSLLGWENHQHPDLIRAVLDVPGHHFNVMWEENVSSGLTRPDHTPLMLMDPIQLESTTRQMRMACKMLELLFYKRR
jgi:pimeloyl-ACP methyl ester carboxylesterase